MTDAGDAEKYTLDYYTTINPDAPEPPFKYRTNYLAEALTEARRIQDGGGYAMQITQDETEVFSREELSGAIARIGALEREQPGRAAGDMIEQVIREAGK